VRKLASAHSDYDDRREHTRRSELPGRLAWTLGSSSGSLGEFPGRPVTIRRGARAPCRLILLDPIVVGR